MELKNNDSVVFTEEPHEYTLFDKENKEVKKLTGITTLIKTVLFPDLYQDVSQEVLARAAQHGTYCHTLCEMFDNGELTETADGLLANEFGATIEECELYAYQDLCRVHQFDVIRSEYLVSDNENFASRIDKVIELPDGSVAIADLKFTYNYLADPVRWQCSFYADMLEAQNPGLKVSRLFCIHIHAYPEGVKAELHELQRIDTELLENVKQHYLAIKQAEENGDELPPKFANPLERKEYELTLTEEEEETIKAVFDNYAAAEKAKKAVMDKFKTMFAEKGNAARFKGKLICFSQSEGTTKRVFDEERFKFEHPTLYRDYLTKIVTTAPRTTFKTFSK
jgi:hypothetical protein